MVTSPIASAATRTSKASRPGEFSAGGLLDRWHLLSLDAPTVALVWSRAFALSAQVHLPWMSSIMLALATWLLYVADRLLDGLQSSRAGTLQERHHFHGHHRVAFLIAAFPVLSALGWFVITRMDPAPRHEDFVLAGCAMLYLLGVHLPSRTFRFPKELVVGTIFAAACVVPAWSRHGTARPMLLAPTVLFAALCSINCFAIEFWEAPIQASRNPSLISWIGTHLRGACFALSVSALAAATFTWFGQRSYAALDLSIAIGAWLILWLHIRRERFSSLRLRSAADAVLLTPVIFFGVRTMLRLILRLHLR